MENLILTSISLEQLTTLIAAKIQINLNEQLQKQKTIPAPETEFVTRKEAAKKLGISLPTLNEWTKTGRVKGYRIGSRVRYKVHEIESSLIQINHISKGR